MAVHNSDQAGTGITTEQNVDLGAGSDRPHMTAKEASLGVSRNLWVPETVLVDSHRQDG